MDRSIYRIIVIGVVAIALFLSIGISSLAHTGKVVPEVLSLTLTGCVSGLIGALSSPNNQSGINK